MQQKMGREDEFPATDLRGLVVQRQVESPVFGIAGNPGAFHLDSQHRPSPIVCVDESLEGYPYAAPSAVEDVALGLGNVKGDRIHPAIVQRGNAVPPKIGARRRFEDDVEKVSKLALRCY